MDLKHKLVEELKTIWEKPDLNWVIIPHLNPDGDAIGACLAFSFMLNKYSVKNTVIVPDSTPDFLGFIPGAGDVLIGKKNSEKANKLITEADVVLLLDHNDFSRAGILEKAVRESKGKKIVIDHHPHPGISADESLLISDTSSSSTCELVLEVFILLGLSDSIDNNIANQLMTGMITDTGAFSYNCSKGSFFHHIAFLLEKGADKDAIIDHIYDKQSEDRMRLVGYLLSEKMEVFPEIRTAVISLTWPEMRRFNFKKGDSEGVVNMPLSIDGIDLSVFISVRDDKTKLSFRSKGKLPANLIAEKFFSGGGHLNAAGGSSDQTVEQTVKYFKSLFSEIKNIIEKADI